MLYIAARYDSVIGHHALVCADGLIGRLLILSTASGVGVRLTVGG